jgi:hypothetical protein
MARLPLRLSRPLYESLPWVYVALGLAGLAGSYLSLSRALSLAIGLLGLLSVLAGIVVLLRRRDYRQLRSQYGNSDVTDLDRD